MKKLIDDVTMNRTLRRITHEIIEQNAQLEQIVLVGIKKKGYPLAKMISENIKKFESVDILVYGLDVSPYRDDDKKQEISIDHFPVQDKVVILVDDVLQTGRTVRAAMDAIIDFGRPHKIQFAVLVDRGHRELPIRPDYIGKNIPTSSDEVVKVQFETEPGIYILSKGEVE
ncbi:MAG: bifunctional pyr operon transcriptional regulator/uracil phosphoribosyltransferase PyrR [Candidatus Izemoplasma sp.]|nr:bifunctional pyr operon transcriptional regulator/uracil phosphoribosyltransferase PyrR [Candidatus Izemoplasma sp.]